MIDRVEEIAVQPERYSAKEWSGTVWFRLLLITALALGVFFRLAGLGHKIYSHDEAFASLYATGYSESDVYRAIWNGRDITAAEIQKFIKPAAGKGAIDTLSYLAMYAPHQAPLFYVLASIWMRLVGFTPADMRGLASLFGILSIPAMYWFSRELFTSRRVALLSTIFFALSPFYILYSQDARPYSLWALATLVSSAALLRAIRKNRIQAWLLYSATLILGVYAHQLFLLVAVAHGCYFVAVAILHRQKGLGGFALACLIAFLTYAPWLYFLITRWSIAAPQMDVLKMAFPWYRYIQRWMLNFSSPLLDLDLSTGNLVPYVLRALLLILLLVALFFLVKHGSREQMIFVLMMYLITAGVLIVPDVVGGGIRSVSGRYFVAPNIVTIPVMAYYISHGLDRANGGTDRKWKILVGLLVIAAIASNINSLYAKTWWNKELSRVSPEFIDIIDHPQTVLVVSGISPTNFGDALVLSLEVSPDIHFRLYRDPDELQVPDNFQNIYWLPGTYDQMQDVSVKKELKISEVLPYRLWKIDETGN